MEKENTAEKLPAADNAENISEENNDITQTDEQSVSPPAETKDKKTRFRIYTPVITAAVILLASIMFFASWWLFFDKDIRGFWTLDFKADNKDCSVSVDLCKDNTCYFHEGGIIYKGTYKITEAENGKDVLNMELTQFGSPVMTAKFYYNVEGNNAFGKKLVLTDLSGLIFSPEKTDETGTDTETSKPNSDYIEENGVRYYVYSLENNNSYSTKTVQYEDAEKDEKLTGIWLNTSDNSGYDNTFAFNDDGTYQITYRDLIYKGCYSAKDGKCGFNLVLLDGSEQKNELEYSFDGEKLVITIMDVPADYIKTDNVLAFDNGIK